MNNPNRVTLLQEAELFFADPSQPDCVAENREYHINAVIDFAEHIRASPPQPHQPQVAELLARCDEWQTQGAAHDHDGDEPLALPLVRRVVEASNIIRDLASALRASQSVAEDEAARIRLEVSKIEDQIAANKLGPAGTYTRMRELIEQVLQARAAHSNQKTAEGMVMVPTETMLIAARDWSHKKYGKPIGDDAATGCWQAMLAAVAADGKKESGNG